MGHVTVLPAFSETDGYESASWQLPADIESEITTLAAVCQVKQQQRVPFETWNVEELDYVDSSDGEQVGSHGLASTSAAAYLDMDGNKSIKVQFLERLAALLCHTKHAHYVSCTSLQEGQDEATILAARNAPREDRDLKLLEDLAAVLEVIATGRGKMQNNPLYSASSVGYMMSIAHLS